MRALFLLSAAMTLASAVQAQQTGAQPADAPQQASVDFGQADIIVTATRRLQALSDVPIAISAVSGEALQNSGASDIRQLNQLSPSLLVSSTSSEAGAGVARIRGIGTVGDNAGLESSVAVFIDGVYRSRSGVGLTELGEIERIEVLRGPQGTLFGRNASAGLISVMTARPKWEMGGSAEVSYGNYDYWRVAGSLTGPLVDEKLAYRLDGIYSKRDGFLTDVISGRKINNRDRWLARGQLLYTPTDDIEFRLIGDFAKRDEECCASSYLPFRSAVRGPDGNATFVDANPIVGILRGLGGVISDDTFARETSLTPGKGHRSNVTDYGISGELVWNFGATTLTSITAYRDWKVSSTQDADFMNLDIIDRPFQTRHFRTFSQELRLQGSAFNDRLDWLVGGYFANEDLRMHDTLRFGQDYTRYADCLVANSLSTTAAGAGIPGLLSVGGPGCMNPAVAGAIASNPAIPAALRTPVALWSGLAIPGLTGYQAAAAAAGMPGTRMEGTGIQLDRYKQNSRNFAIFTHNVVSLTERVDLTLGARYTNERKTLDVDLDGNNLLCGALLTNPTLSGLAAAPCAINGIQQWAGSGRIKEDEWTGTAVLSWRPIDGLMTYGSYSRGYKAGGFNLDRSAFAPLSADIDALKFAPEKVDSFEIGAKVDGRDFRFGIAGFHAIFSQFQLNTFNGVNFVVENVQSCKSALTAADTCDPDNLRGGVLSTGVEVEATLFPAPAVAVNFGYTWANTRYRENLVGTGGRAMPAPLFNLHGNNLSNAPQHVVTGAFTWTPAISDTMGALVYLDWRYQSDFNSGSDLFPEKHQAGAMVVNARLGLNGNERRWAIELWAQNLLNEDYQQVAFNTPLQGSGTIAQTALSGTPATTLFGTFPAEPRTFGVTVKTRF